jgi:hypothetical protein
MSTASIAMILMMTKTSISVKPGRRERGFVFMPQHNRPHFWREGLFFV